MRKISNQIDCSAVANETVERIISQSNIPSDARKGTNSQNTPQKK